MTEDYLSQGINAARTGNMTNATALFAQAVRQDPASAQAWLWLGKVLEDPGKKKQCFDRAKLLDATLADQFLNPEPILAPSSAKIPQVSSETVNHPVDRSSKIGEKPVTRPVLPPKQAVMKQKPESKPRISNSTILAVLGVVIVLLIIGLIGLVSSQNGLAVSLLSASSTPLPLPTDTLSPTVTRTFTVSPTASLTPTRRPSSTPYRTPTPNPTELFGRYMVLAAIANETSNNNQSSSTCAQSYDDLMSEVPLNANDYYNHGSCALDMGEAADSSTDALRFYHLAISDFDYAILTNPAIGNYYVKRGYVYSDLAYMQYTRTVKDAYFSIALENYQKGVALGSDLTHPEFDISDTLISLRQCNQGLTLLKQQYAAVSPSEPPKGYWTQAMAEADMCLGNYKAALPLIEKAESIYHTCVRDMRKTTILMGLGREDDAFDFINACISGSPEGGGYRYFQRGLIDYDRGDLQSARNDLQTGNENTNEHYSLHDYLQGLLALKDGDRDGAVQDFQNAYSSWEAYDGSWLLARITKELVTAGAIMPVPWPAATLEVTPIR